MATNTKRQKDLDIAKGIGIILVVWAHASGPFSNYITGFHMPFFFFISGMLYKNNKDIPNYVKGKVNSLLLPFLWWNLLLYPVFFLLYYWNNWSPYVAIKEILEIITTVNKVPFLGATWFLPSLFWISTLVHIFLSVFKKYKRIDFIGLLICILIAIVGFYITFPYKISRTLICALFYFSGYIFQKYIRNHIPNILKYILSVIFIIIYCFIVSNNRISMASNIYENKLLFVIGAYMAIYFTITISELLSKFVDKIQLIKHLCYLGTNSIHLVIWHFLAFRFTVIIQIIVLKLPLKSITAFPIYEASGLWWILYIFTGIYGSLLVKIILEHNCLTKTMRKLHMIN